MYLNRVELIGFLGNDAEQKETGGGKKYTTLSLATKATWMAGEERKERTEWHRITVWNGLGEYAADFKKGSHIRVEGELRSREYDGQNGHVQTYEIVAESILSLRGGQRSDSRSDSPQQD
jgi:single-strand DNA-binding protein